MPFYKPVFSCLVTICVIIVNPSMALFAFSKTEKDSLEVSNFWKFAPENIRNNITLDNVVKGEELNNALSKNWSESLMGRVAGLKLVGTDMGALSKVSVLLRAGQSLTGIEEALIVVDGVPVRENWLQGTYGNILSDIAADDIDRIEILKDYAAVAVFGAEGRNGAVLIHTKRADKVTKKFSVRFNSNSTMENVNHWIDRQYEYGQGASGENYYSFTDSEDGRRTGGTRQDWGAKFAGQNFYQYDPVTRGRGSVRTPWVPYKDNIKDFFNTGMTFTNNVALEVAESIVKTRISYTNVNNKWIVPDDGYSKNNLGISLAVNPIKKLTISSQASYSLTKSDHLSVNNGTNSLMSNLHRLSSNMDLNWFKDYWERGKEGEQLFYPFSTSLISPYFFNDENYTGLDRKRWRGDIKAQYDIVKGLFLMVRANLDDLGSEEEASRVSAAIGAYPSDFFLKLKNKQQGGDASLVYKSNIGKIHYTAAFGANTSKHRYSIEKQTIKFGVLSSFYASTAENKQHAYYTYGSVGYGSWGDVNISYRKDKYAYSLAPSFLSTLVVGGTLRFADLINLSQINQLNLRLNHAEYMNSEFFFATYMNKKSKTNEISLDIGLFKKLDLGFSFYSKKERQMTHYIGLFHPNTPLLIEFGNSKNRGYEGYFNFKPLQSKDVNLDLYGIFSYTSTRWYGASDQNRPTEFLSHLFERGYGGIYSRDGEHINQIYGHDFERGPAGEVLHYDYSTNSTVSGLPIVDDTNNKGLGNSYAPYQAGLGAGVKIKNVNFNILFDGSWGGHAFSLTHAVLATEGKLSKTLKGREEGVIGDGVVETGGGYKQNTTLVPAHFYYNSYYSMYNTVANVFSTDYIKLREARLDYTFNKFRTGNSFVKNIRVGVYARNLFVLTDWPGYDPEVSTTIMDNLGNRKVVLGYESNQYPSTRTFGLNFSIGI